MPGETTISGDFNGSDDAAPRVRGRAADRDGDATLEERAGRQGRNDRRRAGGIGRGGGRHQPRLKRTGLDAHIGEEVDGRLLHPRIGHGGLSIVGAVQAEGPLHRAGREDQSPAISPVKGQAVRRGRRSEVVTVILDPLGDILGRGGELNKAGRPRPVVKVLVPLVAEGAIGQGRGLPRLERCDTGIPPESQQGVGCRDLNGGSEIAACPLVDGKDGAGQVVFRPTAVRRWAEPRVAPAPRPDVRQRVDLGVGMRFFIAHEGAIRSAGAVDARLPAGLPEHLVAAEEGQVHPRVPRHLDVGPLCAGPVFVVADREKDLMLEDL